MLFEKGRVVGEVKDFREREIPTLRGRRRVCSFEVDGDIEGEGPFWLEDGGGEWHIDVTVARSGASAVGRHWRLVADMAEHKTLLM